MSFEGKNKIYESWIKTGREKRIKNRLYYQEEKIINGKAQTRWKFLKERPIPRGKKKCRGCERHMPRNQGMCYRCGFSFDIRTL